MTEIGKFGIAWQVVSINLILYGSLATVAYSKSWCALVCNFLDMMLGWASEIRRFTRTRENLGEKWRVESPFFFQEWWFQIIIGLLHAHSNRLESVMIFNPSYFQGLKTPEMTDQER